MQRKIAVVLPRGRGFERHGKGGPTAPIHAALTPGASRTTQMLGGRLEDS